MGKEEESKIEMAAEPEELKKELQIGDFYDYATKRNESLKNIPESEIKPFIALLAKEIAALEEIAERDKRKLNLPDEIAKNIAVIWVFSGSGTYFDAKSDDRYRNYPWADWMDRTRLSHAARLVRKITEKVSGQDFRVPLSDITQVKRKTKEAILKYGPYVFYNGLPLGNKEVARALTQEGIIIPKEKVKIGEIEIDKTVDQVKIFELPGKLKEGKEVAIVAHAPHLVRIVRMINKYKPFPEGTKIRLFPVPTPREGKQEYAKMEVSGTLYYTYITQDATQEPYPYEVSYTAPEQNYDQEE